MITQDRLKELLKYDSETGILSWINGGKGISHAGAVAGNKNNRGYITIKVDKKAYLAHRLVFLYMDGNFPEDQVDHINHDSCDNRWCNLRKADSVENGRNMSIHKTNTSGVTGVSKNIYEKKWQSYIKIDGKMFHLGFYQEWFDAVCARKSAEFLHRFHPNHGLARIV